MIELLGQPLTAALLGGLGGVLLGLAARLGRFCTMGAIEDLLGPLLLLTSDASRYMTGQILIVDDGWSL